MDKDLLTMNSDGFDVILIRGGEFGCNVGSSPVVEVGERVAFDAEVSFAKEMCKRWNEHEKLKFRVDNLQKATIKAAKLFPVGDPEMTAIIDELAASIKGYDNIKLRRDLKKLRDVK